MMKKITKLTKTLLVAAGLLVGTSASWAEDWSTVYSQDYSNAETFNQYWTTGVYADSYVGSTKNAAAGASLTQASRTVNEITQYYINLNADKANRGAYFSVPTIGNDFDYSIEFDMALNAPFYSNTNWFIITGENNTDLAVFNIVNTDVKTSLNLNIYNSQSLSSTIGSCAHGARGTVAWYHITLIATSANGIQMSVAKEDGTSVLATTSLSATKEDIAKMTFWFNNGYFNGVTQLGGMANFEKKVNVTPLLTRASAASASATTLSSTLMNTSVKSALGSAITSTSSLISLTADGINASNLTNYVTAIETLETAVANAQASADAFAVLNDLIANASSVSGYSAPAGAETEYTSDANVDAETLIASVRAAIISAGTANENTDITALIANSSFELGSTAGWTTVTSDDTGAREQANATYATTGGDGSYLFNTWSQGTPIKQTLGTLPAGQYKVTAKVASNGATVYLTMNDSHNTGTATSNAAVFVDAEYTFTLGSDTEVTIGAVGGAGDGSFLAEGHWWYKADKFTLTYIGEDPLEQAKAALSNEITAATTVKNSWTPKVGTTPFKYASTYYDVLVAELSEAQAVIDANGDNVDAYTDAKDELETAKNNMGSSELIQPDGSKYYRLYAAGTTLNLNALNGSTFNIKLTSAPYAVKIVPVSAGYNITDVYGNIISHNKNNSFSWGANTGVDMRGERITVAVNDDGTITLTSAYASKVISTSSNTENSTLTSGAAYNKWVVSEAVDVTEVNLGVNAAAGWGTFIAPYDNVIPSTVKAYTVSHKDGNTIYFAENETGVLSANTPYILSTEEVSNVSVTLKGIANNTEDTYTVNGLVGLLTAGTVPANGYVLQNQPEADGVAFYKATAAMTGTANRCYLDLASVSTTPASARATIGFRFYGDDTTGINSIENAQSATNKYYNLNGQRVAQPQKGFYIVNGKKVIIK